MSCDSVFLLVLERSMKKINKAITNGSEAKPVSNGFNCNTLWKNRTITKNVPDIIILYNNLIDVPIRKFLSLNNSTSSNGTLPDLFLFEFKPYKDCQDYQSQKLSQLCW